MKNRDISLYLGNDTR